MTIRQAEKRDAPAVAALWNGMIRDTLATFTTELKTAEAMEALIAERAGAFWVAAEAEALQGFVTFGPFRGGPGYVATVEHTIILDASAQGQGLGRSLMATAMTGAASSGKHVMIAGISSANPNAVAFHAALGFEKTAHMPQVGRKADTWLDLILMQKTLSAP